MKSILIHILSVVCLCGCSRASQEPGVDRSAAVAVPGGPGEYVLPSSISSLTTFGQWLGRPFSWDDEPSVPIDRLSLKGELASDGTAFDKRIVISIDGKNVSVDGKAEGVKVKSIGGNVSINSSAEGVEFVVRGHSSKGNIRIKSDKVALLTLDGLDLTSNSGEALQSKGKATLVISCSEGSENVLRNRKRSSKNLKEEKFKACVSAHGDIILTGKGSLTVTANQKNGIETDKRLVVEDLVRLTIDSCANNAIKATGGFRMDGGQVVLSPSANGVTSKHGDIDIRGGFLKVWTSGEASKALKSDGNVSVSGGELRLICTGKSRHTDTDYKASAAIRVDSSFVMTGGLVKCYANGEGGKGVNADGEVRISGGRLLVICEGGMAGSDFIYSLPKGIKADGKVVISGGEVAVRATGGDGSEGIESKDEVKITGGDVTSLAYDDAINAKSRIFVSGGTVIAYSLENDGFDSSSVAGRFSELAGAQVGLPRACQSNRRS